MTSRQTSRSTSPIDNNTRSDKTTYQEKSRDTSNTPTFGLVPRFSVIICTYNRRSLVLATLASLRKQTLARNDFEIIVVDNGSTDGTFNAVQTYLCIDTPAHNREERWQVRCIMEPQNGLGYARQSGLKEAQADILVFMDDDVVASHNLLEQLQIVYDETDADAVGGCVELCWEAQRPHWLTNAMLPLLGYYAPFRSRTQLSAATSFNSSCFSVKREALQHVGGFPPFLSRRMNVPINVEIPDLCRRLQQEGYKLWYEPEVSVMHRITQARLEQSAFVTRAYWQGRSEALAHYSHQETSSDSFHTLPGTIRELLHSIPYQNLLAMWIPQSSNRQLQARMEAAHLRGKFYQRILLSNHAPIMTTTPSMLLVRGNDKDAHPLIKALSAHGIYCIVRTAHIPFSWIWRYRAHQEQKIGIIHIYRPGSFPLNQWEHQALLFKLRLAQRLGIAIVSTDAGGWWQNVRSLPIAPRRAFEQKVFDYSNIIHTFTPHPEQQYLSPNLNKKTHYLSYPGLRGSLSDHINPDEAKKELGLPQRNSFVYLCFADMHTEKEIIQLIEAFSEMRTMLIHKNISVLADPSLALVGVPKDKKESLKILKRAALNSSIYLFLNRRENDLSYFITATDALIMPYSNYRNAGMPELAMLAYSYEKMVIAPEIPRFNDLLPATVITLYDSRSRSSLAQTMLATVGKSYQHSSKEAASLNKDHAWFHYVQNVLELYRPLLRRKKG